MVIFVPVVIIGFSELPPIIVSRSVLIFRLWYDASAVACLSVTSKIADWPMPALLMKVPA